MPIVEVTDYDEPGEANIGKPRPGIPRRRRLERGRVVIVVAAAAVRRSNRSRSRRPRVGRSETRRHVAAAVGVEETLARLLQLLVQDQGRQDGRLGGRHGA